MNGAELTVDQARAMGWLTRPNQGGTTQAAVAPQGVAQEPEQQPQQKPLHPDLQTEAVSREAEEVFSDLNAYTSALTRVAAVRELTTDGEISEQRMADAASQMGVEPAKVQAMVDTLRPELEAQANNAASQLGVDPADVWEWAWQAKPLEMREAVDRQVTLRNTHGYQKLAKHYLHNLDTIDPGMILEAEVIGGTASRGSDGRIILTTADGRSMTWQQWLATGGKPERVRR
ncbi:hypothetical protein [Dongia deserti]|uniref:hypothetical protein n=1 Tax=Dongia deserti TaxID=2268030 RepID=UPI0013C41E0B|nr:hypothetical protein [Dongia deserti]